LGARIGWPRHFASKIAIICGAPPDMNRLIIGARIERAWPLCGQALSFAKRRSALD
jgi:hypothetical protein